MQKNGAGLHTATSCFWDTASDGIFKLNINIKQGAVLIDGSPEQCIVLQAFMD